MEQTNAPGAPAASPNTPAEGGSAGSPPAATGAASGAATASTANASPASSRYVQRGKVVSAFRAESNGRHESSGLSYGAGDYVVDHGGGLTEVIRPDAFAQTYESLDNFTK